MEMTARMLILTVGLVTFGIEGLPVAQARTVPSSDDRPTAAAAPAPVTVEGCVATSREVRGTSTDLAERIGLDDHFLLTAARVVKGRPPAGTPARRGARPIFAIEGLSDEQLKPHLARRVRIEGHVAPGVRPAGTTVGQPAAALTVTTIRQVRGACPPSGESR
jgi:hypothetical protein